MIDLYKHNNLNYTRNGDMTLTPISCKLKQVLNGENYIEMEHPFDKEGRWNYLLYDNVIAVPTPTSKKQLYRIYNHVKNDDSVIVYARHIFFDLVDKILLAIRPLGNGQTCLNQILANTKFKGYSNITINNSCDFDGKNVVNVLCGGDEESFLKKYGGEILLDNFSITINNTIGSDNHVQALFGYNLESIEEDINVEEVHTRLIPEMSDGSRLTSGTPWIDSKYINRYANVKETIIKFDDIKVKESAEDEEGFATREEAEIEMIRRCNLLLNNGVDLPTVNYKISMVDLSNTIEYKNYKQLQTVNLGDTVTCKHRMLDIDVKARCISFTFDCLTEKYEELELGQFISNYIDMQNEVNADLRKKIELTDQKITLEVSNMSKTFDSKIELTEKNINLSVDNKIAGVNSSINLQANKINAVVQSGSTAGSWELNQNAFKVAFSGASNGYTEIAGDGITINDGRFRIKKNSDTVFYVSTSGRCTADGGFVVEDDDTSCSIGKNGITLTNSNGYTSGLYVLANETALKMKDDLYIGKGIFVTGISYFHDNVEIDGILTIGDNTDIDGSLDVTEDLDVSGEKNCLQSTLNYGKRRINAYETCEYYFSDIGEGTISEGECIVYIDDIFSECVNTNINYQAFTQIYSGNITKIERYENYFVVYGEDKTEFSWELKAKRIGYENNRLEKVLDRIETDNGIENILLTSETDTKLVSTLLENEIESTNLENILLEEVM